jgi:competence protein ComEC
MTLVCFAAAWTAGIALAQAIDIPWQVLPLLALSSLLGLLLWRDERPVQTGALCALAFVLGTGRFLLAVPRFDEKSLATYNDGWVTFEGLIVGEPDERDRHTNLRVRARRLLLPDGGEREINGLVLVSGPRYPRPRYGDSVRVEGLLEMPSNSEDFAYRNYLARRDIHSVMWGAQVDILARNQANPLTYHLLAFKRRAQKSITEVLSEPQASLLTGILLGVESGIPEDLLADFAATGTTHLIAISGFNFTIISGIFVALAQQVFDRRRAIWVAMAAVAVYTLLVGASAAVVRAALMGLLYLLGRYVGRPSYAPVSLGAAAVAMTAWNPHTLWDVGFLLSFAATAGLMLYTEPLERLFEGALRHVISVERAQQIVSLVSEAFLVTVAAQITTVPILLVTFEQLSLVTLLSNLLVLPIQPYLMVTGGIATLLGLILQPLGQLAGWIAWVFLTYTIEMVRLTADLPSASVPVEVEGWMVGVYYALLGGVGWWLARPKERRQELWGQLRSWLSSQLRAKVLVGMSVVLLVLAVFFRGGLPDGRLHVFFLDVGQGDAIFIQTPSGRQALIDGGPSPSVLLSWLGRRMPFWDQSLDLVVLTHPDTDHITGLVSVLERYRVDKVIFREMGCCNSTCEQWRRLVEEEGVAVYRGEAGLEIELDEGLRLEVLHPGTELMPGEGFNDNSLVTRLTYGQASMLLTGDIQAGAELQLLADNARLASTVLKVAHHGSCDSTTPAFLEAVDPQVAVISVDGDNDFGHPCDALLERLNGRTVYRTDKHGTVALITDGKQLWVKTERTSQ